MAWRPEDGRVRIAALQRDDADAVLAMLGRCSAASRYLRFHGATDGVSHAKWVLGNPAGVHTYGAWNGGRCIGLASLAVGDDAAHIGVLVEDYWQKRGAGTALAKALVARARAGRLSSIVADVLGENRFILPLLARIGPVATAFVSGGYTVRIDLDS
jgi:RimJ/RimL family protein N-acetyltransferase